MTKRYDEYKDSGIEWIGEIPSHWNMQKLDNIFDVRDGTHDSPQYFDKSKNTFPFITSKNIKNGKIDFSECKYISSEDYQSIIKRSNVEVGDILMPMIGTIGNPVISKDSGFAIKNVALFKEKDRVYPSFLYYLINSMAFKDYLDINKTGGVVSFISLGDLRNWKISFPNKTEQQAIADYLDNKTSKIDSAVTELEKQKSLLIELKKSTIHQAVTKGLDSTVEMKDSGVEWIWEVPEEFKTLKLKSIIKFFNGYSFVDNDFSDFETGDYLIRIGNLKSNGEVDPYKSPRYLKNPPSRFKIENNSVLMALSGATAGKAVYFDKCKESLYLNQRVAKIKYPSGNLKYLYYYLSLDEVTIELMNIAKITTHPNFSKEHIMNLAISIPEKNKQDKITNYLDKKTGQIDQSIEVIDNQIAKMKEYKKTLINDVVTGKIKVVD